MSGYIGSQPADSFLSISSQQISGNGGATYTLNSSVTSPEDVAIFVNNVRQNVNTYSVSNNQVTLGGTISSSDSCYVIFLGKTLATVNPPSGSVGLTQLSATGTKNNTTFLRGDNTFATPSGGVNTPSFEAVLNADQSYTDNTATKVNFSRETFDTDNCYDNSSNFRFLPTTAGKYFVYSLVLIDVTDLTNKLYTTQISIRKNGSTVKKIDNLYDYSASSGSGLDLMTAYVYGILNMNGSSDYLEIYAKGNGNQNGNFRGSSSQDFSYFGAYKIIT
jgi:hypothetical protein